MSGSSLTAHMSKIHLSGDTFEGSYPIITAFHTGCQHFELTLYVLKKLIQYKGMPKVAHNNTEMVSYDQFEQMGMLHYFFRMPLANTG